VPQLPDASERLAATFVASPHPATIPTDQLLLQCELRTQPRSGPGGQHRNRTSSGAFLHHLPSSLVAEATERRSQAENRNVVVQRLRFRLALLLRTPSILDRTADATQNEATEIDATESSVRQRYAGHPLRLNEQNEDKPAVMALLLNDLHASGGQPSLVSKAWKVSTSRIVAFLKSHAPAFALVNQIRQHHGRGPLK
tara:strand:+ start:178720 stop:179313 length:594 start_codon:yes stop_codon:yes gene_type:complete